MTVSNFELEIIDTSEDDGDYLGDFSEAAAACCCCCCILPGCTPQ